jgi:hypothetical protein
MKFWIVLVVLGFVNSFNAQINKAFYSAVSSRKQAQIAEMIENIEKKANSNQKDAYLGALYMQMAEFEKVPKKKLETFKKGRLLLENAISKDNSVENRFLRLMIQENCPKILKYHTNISDDVNFIKKNYASQSADLVKLIKDYAAQSKSLKL